MSGSMSGSTAGFMEAFTNLASRVTSPEWSLGDAWPRPDDEPLEYNGRDFDADFETFKRLSRERASKGSTWAALRVDPLHTGDMHRHIDREEGCPNPPSLDEARLHVARRHRWVLALEAALILHFSKPPQIKFEMHEGGPWRAADMVHAHYKSQPLPEAICCTILKKRDPK